MPGTIAPQRARAFRKPSGRPNPPIVLFAGPEFTGKSTEAALGSGSDLIAATYWLQVGGVSSTADQYGRLEGARYEIVPHDGSFDDVLDALRFAISQPRADDGKRNMLVLDDITSLWELLSDEVALVSRKRAERRGLRLDDAPVDDERDLWIQAKDRWGEMLWLLRQHNGPILLIARQETVTAFENDKPTAHTTRRIKAEKNIRAAVDVIVEFHDVGEAYITGAHSTPEHWKVNPGWVYRYEGLDNLLERVGYQDAADVRAVTELRPEAIMQSRPQQAEPAAAPPALLTGKQAMLLIHQALQDKTDPKARLVELREEWGKRTLRSVQTETRMFGELDADALLVRSLAYVEAQAKKRAESGAPPGAAENAGGEQPGPVGEGSEQSGPPAESDPPAAAVGEPEQAREHAVEEPPVEDSTPPPPDPQGEEPPPGESPEDTTEAEEPQAPPAPPVRTRRNRNADITMQALDSEADIQARLQFLTLGNYLEPISKGRKPTMMELLQYLNENRPPLIAQLEADGEKDLAKVYRDAPIPDPQLAKKFAAYFDAAQAK